MLSTIGSHIKEPRIPRLQIVTLLFPTKFNRPIAYFLFERLTDVFLCANVKLKPEMQV